MKYRNPECKYEKTFIAKLDQVRFFCTATLVHGDRICLVGGNNANQTIGSVHWLDLKSRTFSNGPSLNQPRNFHSTILFGAKLYTLGGRISVNGGYRDSIEILDVMETEAQWSIFTNSNFSARQFSVVCRIGPSTILIAGGYNGDYIRDAILFDPDKKTFKKSETDFPFGFGSYNQARMIAPGEVIALVETEGKKVSVV